MFENGTGRTKGRRRVFRTGCAAVVVAGVALASAACSSSGGATTSASGSSSGTAAGTSTSASSQVAQAKAYVASLSKRPTALGQTTPVGKPIPKGKKVEFISCGVADCTQIAGMLKAQVEALGWTFEALNTDGSPESQANAFAQVLRDKPAGVIADSVPPEVYAKDVSQLKSENIWVATTCETAGAGANYAICTPEQQGPVGKVMASIAIADSNGSAHALYVNVPAFDTLTQMSTEFAKTMKSDCAKCTSANMDLSISQVGSQTATKIVSYLRAHSDVNYVGLSIDSLANGLPAALKAAGLNKVKIIGEGGGNTTWQYIQSKQQLASVPFFYIEAYLASLDSIVRHVAGVAQLPSKLPQPWIVDQGNVSQTKARNNGVLPVVADAEAQFHTLWGLSS